MADTPPPHQRRLRAEASIAAQREAWQRLWDWLLAPLTPEEQQRKDEHDGARPAPDHHAD
jgi:hypothetical protein